MATNTWQAVNEASAHTDLMRSALNDLRRKHRMEETPFVTAVEIAELELKALLKKYFVTPDAKISLGYYECKDSPTGACVYDVNEDPSRDDCLVCHDPAERK